jgi:hypothetical protein
VGPELAEKIASECAASLYACQTHFPKLAIKQIVYTGDRNVSLLSMTFDSVLGCPAEECDWEQVERLGWRPDGGNTSMAVFPALAGVVN